MSHESKQFTPLNVPNNLPTGLGSYLLRSFRYVADAITGIAYNVSHEDIEITDSAKGLILTSPNGTRYRVTVNNAGALVITAI